ncbi:3-phenylpropionate/cinnamic acid dioxygenase ferredoxin--NAD(+) reductase subunit [Paraburkholderia youngii]|uniref:3-phenylpropionate/cinnamic acid dioxygenase ferredoxin--NAD(+) reductase subunit n=1 Tax=Paraburkholderia youngii TaxID=2782701 RepID=UPI001590763B|nr:3-phenylpropionate/cinnamic acid dioxygenase ferredoxin--NAD(+) reductase subunit [Paraburkholderia youngii]NUX55558.1 phenylpropionate dioxygenase ferredoxin reductase subunit [Paraburkholderia youngii]
MNRPVYVIVGAGQAGANAAAELRRQGFEGRVLLVGDEAHPPYERPPLSKDVLLRPEQTRCAVHADDFYAQHDIELQIGVAVSALDRQTRKLTLANGTSIAYDKLLLATGAQARRLPLLDALGENVHTLRTLDDARKLASELRAGRRILLVGAGVIGLELASSAADLSAQVTVIEAAPLAMGRCAPVLLSQFLCDVHRRRGVTFHFGATLANATRENGEIVLNLQNGTRIAGDAVIYGVGAQPDIALARSAGLAIDNGIVIDAACRTSDVHIYAAGDVASRHDASSGTYRRHETWDNAQKQGIAAARAMLGLAPDAQTAPWFWTDQCGLNVQFVGDMSAPDWIVRGQLNEPPCMLFGLDEAGALVGAITVNFGREMRSVRQLVERRVKLAREVLLDPGRTMREIAKEVV